MKRFVLAVVIGLSLGQFAFARDGQAAKFYDEVYDARGNLRPQYQGLYPELTGKTKAVRQEFLDSSLEAYHGDNKLNDVPLIMTAEEYDNVIAPGVEQRARAIMALIADEYSGERTYRAVVNPKIIEKIRERNGELGYSGYISPNNIAFFYGPDLMRNARGQNVVLEDNGGAVGLAFDLRLAHQFMLENNPEVLNYIKPRDPEVFYKALAEKYKARAEKNGGKAVLLVSPLRSDSEDQRVREIFKSYGIEIVYPNARDVRLLIQEDGVYTYSKSSGPRSKEKVGFVILAGDPVWYDNTHPATRERSIIEEAKNVLSESGAGEALKRKIRELLAEPYSKMQMDMVKALLKSYDPRLIKPRAFGGLMNAILTGKVGTNVSPGTEFVSDKEFYIYVEDLIRFYLNEEPILINQPTWLFANAAGELREGVFNKCFDNFSRFVIKPVDGRGGDGVFVGPHVKPEAIPRIKTRVRANPSGWLCQEYMAPSRLGDLIVDRRAIANTFLERGRFSSVTSNVSASRGNSPKGSGKVNLSGNGRAVTVLVPDACESWLQGGRDRTIH